MATHPRLDFRVERGRSSIMLLVVDGSMMHRRATWTIPDDAGYDEVEEVTLRAVIEILGEAGRAGYAYRRPGK